MFLGDMFETYYLHISDENFMVNSVYVFSFLTAIVLPIPFSVWKRRRERKLHKLFFRKYNLPITEDVCGDKGELITLLALQDSEELGRAVISAPDQGHEETLLHVSGC